MPFKIPIGSGAIAFSSHASLCKSAKFARISRAAQLVQAPMFVTYFPNGESASAAISVTACACDSFNTASQSASRSVFSSSSAAVPVSSPRRSASKSSCSPVIKSRLSSCVIISYSIVVRQAETRSSTCVNHQIFKEKTVLVEKSSEWT